MTRRPSSPAARQGFTLVELLTVIAIIGILAALIFPSIGKVRESAAKNACAGNPHQSAVATLTYASDPAQNGNYTTYSYFGYIPLAPGAETAFGITDQGVLKNAETIPADIGLWACLTDRNGGRYHGHGDLDTAQLVQGQNAAHADGSLRWVKGEDLIPYATADSIFYGPRSRT